MFPASFQMLQASILMLQISFLMFMLPLSSLHSYTYNQTPFLSPTDKYDTTIERLGCPEVPVKLCVGSQPAKEKCEALRQVLKSRRIRPSLECVMPTSNQDCLAMVASGAAHITTADGGDVYRGHV